MTPREHVGQRSLFLAWFERGRRDEERGEDYGWRRIHREHGSAAVAGYLEGVASTREMPQRFLWRHDRRDRFGRYTGVAA